MVFVACDMNQKKFPEEVEEEEPEVEEARVVKLRCNDSRLHRARIGTIHTSQSKIVVSCIIQCSPKSGNLYVGKVSRVISNLTGPGWG